jgi:hypothetical protein
MKGTPAKRQKHKDDGLVKSRRGHCEECNDEAIPLKLDWL